MKIPAVRFIDFGEIPARSAALTDASSLREIGRTFDTLTAPLTPQLARHALSKSDPYTLAPALSFLERWLVADTVVADLVALASLHRDSHFINAVIYAALEPRPRSRNAPDATPDPHAAVALRLRQELFEEPNSTASDSLSSARRAAAALGIAVTTIPEKVFKQCLQVLKRTSSALREVQPTTPWGSFGFGDEKAYGEALGSFYREAGGLGRSHLGVERTLFYYEAAAVAGLPLVLHPDRDHEISAIDRAAVDAYDAVRQTIRLAFDEPVRKQLKLLGLQTKLPWPALRAKLVSQAGKERASILEVAMTMKASRSAVAFRRWLGDLHEALAGGSPASKLEALRMLRDLKAVAARWCEELDVAEGVRHKRHKLKLSWVPRIGGLLELLDTSGVADPILNRKGHLTFISSWFEP